MNANIVDQTNMTREEEAYVRFVLSKTHNLQKYKPIVNAWFSRVGYNDEERVAYLEKAHGCILTKPIGAVKMQYEREYLLLYHDMEQNESQWFDDILSNPYNLSLCDGIIVVLGTLASLKRNRDELQITGEILELDKKVIEIYDRRAHTTGLVHAFLSSDPQVIVNNCEGLKYKYHMIWVSYLPQLKASGVIIENYESKYVYHFRSCIKYEIERNMDFDTQLFSTMLYVKFKRAPNIDDLNRITDKELFDIIHYAEMKFTDVNDASRFYNEKLGRQAALRFCNQCRNQEKHRGEYKCCAKCKKAYYCSSECQVMAWKGGHKQECQKKHKVAQFNE